MQTKKTKICDGCNQPQIIWKSSGTGGRKLCKSCWSAHSGKTKQIPTVRQQKPIPPRSAKRSKEERLYLGKRIIFLDKFQICQAHLPCCTNQSNQVHHKKGRIGELLTNEKFWLSCCAACHDYIENHREFAIEKGYSLKRTTDEQDD